MKTVTIANAHSTNNPDQKITIDLQGGSPYFGYLWIDDVCYVVRKSLKGKTFLIAIS